MASTKNRIFEFFARNWTTILALAIALAWKIIWLALDRFPFNSDEAIVGLMAKHIIAGEHPLFFYGQAYMGSLDAYLVAGGFLVFGVHVWVIRAIQFLLYIGTILVILRITNLLFHDQKIELVVGLLLAIPTGNVHLYTTVSLGGYGEALLIGSTVLFLWLKLRESSAKQELPILKWILPIIVIGFLSGIGVWANALSLVFSLPVILAITVHIIWRAKQKKLTLILPILIILIAIGLFPYWVAIAKSGFQVYLSEIFGSAIAVEKTSWLVTVGNHVLNFLILGVPVILGFRPPWAVVWLVLPLIPFALFIWIFIFGSMRKLIRQNSNSMEGVWILLSSILMSLLGFIFTSFGNDPSGRYFIAITIPLSILAASSIILLVRQKYLQWIMIGVLLLFNVCATIQCGIKQNPGFTTQFYEPSIIDHSYDQELIQFLEVNGELRGYSNYWVAYPIAFLSNEKIIYVPQLPYHLDQVYTSRDDRYKPYDTTVLESDRAAFITTRNPDLDQNIVKSFQESQITFLEKQIGDYHIFYNLSKKIDPYALGLIKSE